MLSLALVVIATNYIAHAASITNCTSHHSYILAKGEHEHSNSSGNSSESVFFEKSLTSSHSTFAPYFYYIPSTELTLLSKDDNTNICDLSSNTKLTTNLTNKVLLLYTSTGDCSVHSKVLKAQQNGAIAVLLSNNASSRIVYIITDDNPNITTAIPIRSISRVDAQMLEDDFIAGYSITIEFGCYNDTLYPSDFCLSEPHAWVEGEAAETGQYPLEGEYVRQPGLFHNGFPVWKLSGYAHWQPDLFMYMHSADNNTQFIWSVAMHEEFFWEYNMLLRCVVPNVHDPVQCPQWANWGANQSYSTSVSLVDVLNVTVTNDLCKAPNRTGSTVCFHSQRSSLAGLHGTWRLQWNDEPDWYRDLNECDERTGVLVFYEEGDWLAGFSLYELSAHTHLIATCDLPTLDVLDAKSYEKYKYRPDLCASWYTRPDYDLSADWYNLKYDATFEIMLGECNTSITSDCVEEAEPDELCMPETVVHGYLQGDYVKLEERGPHFDSPIYKRSPPDDAPWLNTTLYIFYGNEFYAEGDYDDWFLHSRFWILSPLSLTEALQEKKQWTYWDLPYLGYCHGFAYGNPTNCEGWTFQYLKHWDLDEHYDEDLRLMEGECGEDFWPYLPYESEWTQYICVAVSGQSELSFDFDTAAEAAMYAGAYEIDLPPNTNMLPIWYRLEWGKREEDMLIEYNYDIAQWIMYNASVRYMEEKELRCDPYNNKFADQYSYDPLFCIDWRDSDMKHMLNMRVYQCSDEEIRSANTPLRKAKKKADISTILGVVFGVLIGLVCIAVVLYFVVSYINDDTRRGKGMIVQHHDVAQKGMIQREDMMTSGKTELITVDNEEEEEEEEEDDGLDEDMLQNDNQKATQRIKDEDEDDDEDEDEEEQEPLTEL